MDSPSPTRYLGRTPHHHPYRRHHRQNSPNSSNVLHQQPPLLPPRRYESGTSHSTTFVQADTGSFRNVVQVLTGSEQTARQASSAIAAAAQQQQQQQSSSSRSHIPAVRQQHQSGFKLYERRNSLSLNPLFPTTLSSKTSNAGGAGCPRFSPRSFPGLVLSPVTPLIPDPFGRFSPVTTPAAAAAAAGGAHILDLEAETRAIKEKGFYLLPSPPTTPGDSQPRLLALFPTVPAAPASSSSSSPHSPA